MTVFKAFWNIVNKYKGTIILYTVMLIIFGGINMSTQDNQINFTNEKPDVLIIDNDNSKLSLNLIKYMEENSNIIDIRNDEESINDALFYRDVNYIIYIPKDYSNNILDGKNIEIDIKKTGDYQSSLAEMMLTRYMQIQNIYKDKVSSEEQLISSINTNLTNKANIQLISKLNINKTSQATYYFNFASYSIMAVIIFVICLVLCSFKQNSIKKRNIVSKMDYKKHNRLLLLSSLVYSIIVSSLFIILGFIILKDIMFTTRGLVYIINLFIFAFCCLTIALLISNITNNKNAIGGIVNVVALGSSFLCGAFVPVQYLPKVVLSLAHVLPTYWYINSNELLKNIEVINNNSLKPIIINMLVIIIFSILFIIINNIISRKKRKLG